MISFWFSPFLLSLVLVHEALRDLAAAPEPHPLTFKENKVKQPIHLDFASEIRRKNQPTF